LGRHYSFQSPVIFLLPHKESGKQTNGSTQRKIYSRLKQEMKQEGSPLCFLNIIESSGETSGEQDSIFEKMLVICL
jgi:hypothetical protein